MSDTTTDSTFDQLQETMQAQGAAGAIESLAQHLRAEKKYHELFDVRLMQARHKHGLPILGARSLEELPEPLRTEMEEEYVAACREVGQMFLDAGRVRDAWMYLRPAGDKSLVKEALEKLPPEEHETIIQIGLYEGVAPTLGFQAVIDQMGVCNAISLFDSDMQQRPREERQAVASLLVRNLHADLERSVRAEIEKEQGSPAKETTVEALVRDRDWLFSNNNYHVDTTHLNSIVRFALLVEDPEVLRLAVDLTEYGRRLSPTFQFASEEPFAEAYVASGRFFRALLGEDIEAGLAYFREKAQSLSLEEAGTGPAEAYVSLLARLGRYGEALEAAGRLIPPGTQTTGFAPSVLELADQGGEFERLRDLCRERGDLVGFTIGLIGK